MHKLSNGHIETAEEETPPDNNRPLHHVGSQTVGVRWIPGRKPRGQQVDTVRQQGRAGYKGEVGENHLCGENPLGILLLA